ncbi:MAG TPA: YceI family protein [Candidatus Sulfotelmatobacter sp.]|nr:YceI family protein [Candidatus Sulfotelmatobacter sp.]
MNARASSFARHRLRVVIFVTLCSAFFVPAGPLRAQETVVRFDPAQTQIHITLDSTFHTVHGTFKLKSGEIHFDPATGKARGSLVVDALSGDTDNKGRDKKMHQEIIQSPKFNEIVFTANAIKGSLVPRGSSEVQLSGIFRLCGQDHEMTMTAVVVSTGGRLQATTHFSIPYVKWGLKNPSTFLLHADDTVDVQIQAAGELAPASAQK